MSIEAAVEWKNNLNTFVTKLQENSRAIASEKGRKFVRVLVNGETTYFVDISTGQIYGAKSDTQFNPRRMYGTLDTVNQWDWAKQVPLQGTDAEATWLARENAYKAGYKKRGRPRKVTTSTTGA